MAIALRQSAIKVQTGVGSSALAFPSNILAGSVITVHTSCYYFLSPVSVAPTDTLGHTYTRPTPLDVDIELAAGDVILTFYYANNTSAGANTVTVSNSGAPSAEFVFVICEWTGVDTASPINGTPVRQNSTTDTTPAAGVIDPTNDPSVIIGAATHTDGNTSFTQEVDYTLIAEEENGNSNPVINVCYRALSSGTDTVDWTLGTSAENGAYAVALREAAGAAATSLPPNSLRRMRHLIGR